MRIGRIRAVLMGTAMLLAAPAVAHACADGAEEMAKNEDGFIYKVIAGSNEIRAYVAPDGGEEVFKLELLKPYYVICEEGGYLFVTDIPASTVDEALTGNIGYVDFEQVYPWPTREALRFDPFLPGGERPELVAWDDEAVLEGFLETGDQARFPPAFREDLDATLKRERATRPYPVLGSEVRTVLRTREKRVFEVLLPAALPPTTAVVIEDDNAVEAMESVEAALTQTTFAIVFDATASMEKVALDVARDLKAAFDAIPEQAKAGSTAGFVFFRDDGDPEEISIIPPMPIDAAVDMLQNAAKLMAYGGDAAEPILDATYVAAHLYDWGAQQVGKRIIIGVLNTDAKPLTTGLIYDRVPAGRDATQVAADLTELGIEMITVQAGPEAGPNLVDVLSTLAVGSGGQFISWDGDRGTAISAAVSTAMTEKVLAEREAGETIMAEAFEYNDFPAIPLAVLGGERLERLRRAGVNFNITNEEGGVLVTQGYMLESSDLLEPLVSVEKETLETLINLLSVLAVTGVTPEDIREAAGETIAAIAGEDYDPSAPIGDQIQKQLGIQFRQGVLNYSLDEIVALSRDERLAVTKRFQEAQEKLTNFLEANLDEFDTNIAVWMPVSELP